MSDAKMRMSAYYYGFDATGIPQIDLILSAVACAGKAFHHTESWDDECVWPGHSGTTPQQWIQNAANAAAADLCASRQQVRELEWQRGTRKDDRTAYSDCGVFAVGSDDAGGWFAVHRFIDAEGQVEDKEIGWAETREIAMDDCEHEHRSRILAALTPAPDAVDVHETPVREQQTGLSLSEVTQAPDAAPAPGVAEAVERAKTVLICAQEMCRAGHPVSAMNVATDALRILEGRS